MCKDERKMTDEELFRKYCPDFCTGSECLEPYFSLFQAGMDVMRDGMDQLQEEIAGLRSREHYVGETNSENIKLVEENKRMKEQLREAKDGYDRAADKTPIRACGAEYRLFCDIERILEDWGAEE